MNCMSFEEAQVLPFTFEHQTSHNKASVLRIVDVAKERDVVARSKLGAARMAASLTNNIAKLKKKLHSRLLLRDESVLL